MAEQGLAGSVNVPVAHVESPWRQTIGAYLAEVHHRSGSERTPYEYARIIGRFLDDIGDPVGAKATDVHAFAYGAGPSGREPSRYTI